MKNDPPLGGPVSKFDVAVSLVRAELSEKLLSVGV